MFKPLQSREPLPCHYYSLGPSHQWRHKSRVLLRGTPCAHGVAGTPHGEVRDIKHWLPTKGRVPNACVRGFGDQTMSLEVHNIES